MKNFSHQGISLVAGIITLAVIVVIVVAGVWTYSYLGQSKQTQIPTPTPTAAVNQNNNPNPNETADWKTYANTDLGFSIKYPSSWDYQILPCNMTRIAFYSNQKGNPGCGLDTYLEPISLFIYDRVLTNADTVANNDNNTAFPGSRVLLKLNDNIQKEIYTKMLSTFKFTK